MFGKIHKTKKCFTFIFILIKFEQFEQVIDINQIENKSSIKEIASKSIKTKLNLSNSKSFLKNESNVLNGAKLFSLFHFLLYKLAHNI